MQPCSIRCIAVRKVKLALESAEVLKAKQRPISIGGNKLILCPWSSVGVKYHKMSTMREFYDLMNKTKFVRQSIVSTYISEKDFSPAIQNQIEALTDALMTLEKVPKNELGVAQVPTCIGKSTGGLPHPLRGPHLPPPAHRPPLFSPVKSWEGHGEVHFRSFIRFGTPSRMVYFVSHQE